MPRQRKGTTILLSAVLLMTFAGVSLFADMQSDSTKEGGTLPPVTVFDATTMDVVETAPMAPPPMVETKPYTEVAPVDPDAVDAKIEGDDDQTETMSGVSKFRLYIDKEPASADIESRRREISDDELSTINESSRDIVNPYFVSTGQINQPIPDGGWLWWRAIDDTQAPVGAVVTNLEYRTYIGPLGDPSGFYCADYEIYLFTGSADRELLIYDNLGGRTDGGHDDDVEDDANIYLNWRNTHFFDGDDARDWFGIWVDDLYTPDSGQLNYIDFWVHWEVPLPNLRCYVPADWDSAIVASSVTGTHTADSLTGDEPAYIDWAIINDGGANVVGRFYSAIYIDGSYITQWYTDNLQINIWAYVADYMRTLPAGDHEICIVADHTGLIDEENENDNSCCFTYHWYPPQDLPDLHCYQPGDWDGPIVVSAVRGTNTQDAIRLCDTAWVDWAVANTGGSPTADQYYIRLLVDGVAVHGWFKDPPHNNGIYIWVTDYPLVFNTAGNHIVSLEIDYTGTIPETNENNNSCEIITVVVECEQPDITCHQLDGWDGPIVVSNTPGTNTQSPPIVGENAYIDFGLVNIGTASTTVNFWSTLYVDGDSLMSWFSTPMAPGDIRWVADYTYVFATSGYHTVRVVHDLTDVISESNETNNWCEFDVEVQSAGSPDIRVEPMSLTIEEECRGSASGDSYFQPEKMMPDVSARHLPGELIIKIKHDTPLSVVQDKAGFKTGIEELDLLASRHGAQYVRTLFAERNDSPLLRNTFLIRIAPPYDFEGAARAFYESDMVELIDLNYLLPVTVTPNDPEYVNQWGLPIISAPQGWDQSQGSSGVVIAIVDTGVDWDHPDLAANIWNNSGEIPDNGVDDDGNGFIDDVRGWDFLTLASSPAIGEDGDTRDNNPMDFHGHGSHCSGIASAVTDNGIGVAGLGWNCSIMPVRAGYQATDGNGYVMLADAADGIQYAADNGAKAINLSFGSGTGTILVNAVQYAYNLGAVTCYAAGNANDQDAGSLGDLHTTLAVAATDSSDQKASFSSYGSWVDVSAPGVSIRSTVIGNGYESWNGTSMATPFVAGLVGLVHSLDPSLSAGEIMSLIKDSTDNIDAQNPSYIGMLGTGRINAAAALQAVSGSDVFVVYNDGGAPLYVDSINSPQSWLSANPGSFPVAPGGSQTVSVVVDWNQISSPVTGQMQVWSNDPDENPVNVDVLAVPCPDEDQMISGYVRDGTGGGIPDVTMTFAGLGPVSTNSNGYYERLVPHGWSGRVTPSKHCWEFSPEYIDYANVTTPQSNQNYVGALAEFTISGQVHDAASVGIPGVSMTGLPCSPVPITTADGRYSCDVPCGWSGRVTPTLDCWGFSPVSRSYVNVQSNQTDQNYLATRVTYSLSGYVLDVAGAPMPGVTMTGLPCPDEITDANGFYRCAVPCGWSGTVTPVLTDWSFIPRNRNYLNVQTSMSDQDYVGEYGPPSCDPGFEIAMVTGSPASLVGVPVIANGMQSTQIGGLEFHMTYPVDCLGFVGFGTGYLDGATVNGTGGEVHIVWEDFMNPITVPDGEAIDTIWFNVLGSEGDTCEMCWLPGNEVVDPIGDPIAGLGYCCGGVVVDENHSISGNVVYYDMVRRIPGVQVDLTGAAIAGTVTDAAGHYAFTDLASGNYVVTPSHGANDPGVSVADIIKIRRHLAVLEPFTSGYQLIAGDVTCDCAVSVSDIIKIRRYLAVLDTLPCGNWAFVDSSYAVSTTNWCPVPGEIVTALTSNQTDSSFVGVRKGDVNNTWSPSVAATAGRQADAHATAGEMTLTMNDVSATGETVTLPVILGHGTPVAGVELHLRFDPRYLAFAGLKSEVMNDVTISHDQSSVHLVWENLGQPIDLAAERILAGFEFKLLNEPDEFTEVAITSAEVVDESGTPFVLLQQNGRVLASSGVASETLPGDFWLGQNYPNPFNPETDIAFYLPRQARVTLAIYNMLGQQVTVLASGQLAAGEHTVHWDGRDASGRLVSSGIYLYRLNSSEFSEARKMLLLK